MKQFIKANIRPIFIGFSFYLFILLGHNSEFISNDSIRVWTAIISGVIFIYLIAYASIDNKKSIGIAAIGFLFAQVLFSIAIPIFMIVNQVFFTNQSQKEQISLLKKNNIELISNSMECYKIKYGTFLNGIDTIIRYSEDNKDYELIKTVGFEDKLNRIRWLDSCSYIRIINNSVIKYIRLGNIKNGKHQMYEKPTVTHKMEVEEIKTLIELIN